MKRSARTIIVSLFLSVCVLFVTASGVPAKEYEALEGLKSAKAVFDVRIGNPKAAALHIKLIHQTYKDLVAEKKNPVVAVVFIGPSVKLISKNREGFTAEDQKILDEIAGTITRMSKDGVKLEICLVAARVFGVDPASILPEIKPVANGWVSVIGYQAHGFSLVPVY
jgi:intracellular sulfur oxidation DsrE/DsrF family protein